MFRLVYLFILLFLESTQGQMIIVPICDAGYYLVGSTCYACPKGYYTSSRGLTVCTACTYGTFQDNTGQTLCKTCTQCPTGTYTSTLCTVTSDAVCTACPIGQYGPTQGAFSCVACYIGTYQDTTGQVQCKLCSSNCAIGQYLAVACTSSMDAQCRACTSPTTTVTTGQSSCNACIPGYFRNIAGSCLPCAQASGCLVNTYKYCPGGTGSYQCQVCSGYTGSTAGLCPAGQEPNQICTGAQTTDASCTPCNAGYSKASSSVWCSVCGTGYYQPLTGQSSCSSCTVNSNVIYLSWGSVIPTTNKCPYQCVPGYYIVNSGSMCMPCTGTGVYSTGTTTSCLACTNNQWYSYYLTPVSFNYGSNNCPWDCIAGYNKYRQAIGLVCIMCVAGTYHSAANNIYTETLDGSYNRCLPCSSCQGNGISYMNAPCTITSDTGCFTCKTQCNPGYYKSSPCKNYQDLQCTACNPTCPAGYYLPPAMLGACTGQTTVDAVQAGCLPCLLPSQCGPGEYLSGTCKGNRCDFLLIDTSLTPNNQQGLNEPPTRAYNAHPRHPLALPTSSRPAVEVSVVKWLKSFISLKQKGYPSIRALIPENLLMERRNAKMLSYSTRIFPLHIGLILRHISRKISISLSRISCLKRRDLGRA